MTDAIDLHLTAAREAREEGRAADARNSYARAAALARESARPLLRAHALGHLSDLDREARQPESALAHAEQAVALYRKAKGTPPDLANALRLQALALEDLRRNATAMWTEARDLYRAAGTEAGVMECEAKLAPTSED